MTIDTIWTVLATVVTVLGSTGAWAFYERRYRQKEKVENFMKDECRERIAKLEVLLERSAEEKDEMRGTILNLTAQVAELRVKVQYLESENEDLHKIIKRRRSQEE